MTTEEQNKEELQLNDGAEAPDSLNLNPAEMTPEEAPEVGAFGIDEDLSDIYTETEFIAGFRGCFNAAGDITGIKSLPINLEDTRERVGSERAAVRLYAACQKYNWLHFIIDKKSGWFADIIIIGSFAVAKGKAVAAEVGYTPKLKFMDKIKLWFKFGKKEQQEVAA